MNNSSFVQLDKRNYDFIRRLIPEYHHSLVIESVLQGLTPGYLFADDLDVPRKAVLWDGGHTLFIFGEESNKSLTNALRSLFEHTIVPIAGQKEDIHDFEIRIFHEHQIEGLRHTFHHHPLMFQDWRYYSIHPADCPPYEPVPDKNGDIIIKQIDMELLQQKQLENLDEVIHLIDSNWLSKELFLQKGFGICVLQRDTIISWCVADYVVDDQCEIGIETDERFWQQGFATLAVQAAIEYCKQQNIRKIGWHCRESNLGSYKLAEKSGFKQEASYKTMHGWFNRFDNLLVNAYHSLNETEEFELAVKFYEQAFAMIDRQEREIEESAIFTEDNKPWCYYSAACAWSLCGDTENAFSFLEAAIATGFDDIEELIEEESLDNLKRDEKWEKLIQKLSKQVR